VNGPPAPASRLAQPPRGGRDWGPGRVALGVLALLAASVLEAGVVAAFDPSLDSLGAKLALQALLAATLVAVAFAVSGAAAAAVPPGALGLRRPHGRYLLLPFLAYVAYLVFALAYTPLTHPHQQDVTRELGVGAGPAADVAAALLIVVAAPISEEIFFRGFLFGGLRNRLRFALAGPISAAIFGLFHYTGPESWAVIPQLAFLGLALAYVKERTGSILPTIAVHAANNAIAFAILTS